jgi:hypothetical protein
LHRTDEDLAPMECDVILKPRRRTHADVSQAVKRLQM